MASAGFVQVPHAKHSMRTSLRVCYRGTSFLKKGPPRTLQGSLANEKTPTPLGPP